MLTKDRQADRLGQQGNVRAVVLGFVLGHFVFKFGRTGFQGVDLEDVGAFSADICPSSLKRLHKSLALPRYEQ